MYCPNCKQYNEGVYCPECGAKLIEAPERDEVVARESYCPNCKQHFEGIYCPECGNKMETIDDWQAFAYKSIKCKKCGKEIDTFGYIFDFEGIDFCN